MSKAVYIQTTPAQKLPYLHSKFKPRSKFAKSFGGCSRFSKLRQSLPQDDAELTSRLPRITYNAQDIRETPPTFGFPRRGTRREYPGFTGHTKILRNRKKHETTPQATNGSHNFSGGSQSQEGDNNHLALTSLRELRDPASCLSGLNGSTVPRDYDWSRSQDFARQRRDQRLSNVSKQYQSYPVHGQDSNSTTSGLLSEMDSLFIYDDDAANEPSGEASNVGGGQSPKPEAIDSFSKEYNYKDKDAIVQFSLLGDGDSSKDEEEVKNDPFAKNFEEKLREIRGKSGMKRDKTKKRLQGKRSDVEMRPLGDVITNKRLQELLLPQNSQGVTIRLHS